MNCPRCGAENPEDAVSCNMCFHRFGEEPKEPEMLGSTDEKHQDSRVIETSDRRLYSAGSMSVVKQAFSGGSAAFTGVAFFISSVALLKVVGINMASFMFTGKTVLVFNFSVLLMSVYYFALLTGGVFGNIIQQPNKVLAKRLIAATIALAVWLLLMNFVILKSAGSAGIVTGLSIYTSAMLIVFPFAAAVIAFADGLNGSVTSRELWYEVVGGIIGSMIGMIPIVISLAMIDRLAPMVPQPGSETYVFIIKLIINISVVGFLVGAFFWLGCAVFKRIAARKIA